MEIKGQKILVADDEPDILEIIQYNLKSEGYEVYTARDGDEAIQKARQIKPQLIILDVMMLKKTGVEVCEILCSQVDFKDTLIIFLTVVKYEQAQIKAFEMGSDDYVNKPISPKLLMTRVNALFRRLNKQDESMNNVLQIKDLVIDPLQFVVSYKDKEIVLAKKEFELLYLLASKPGRVF